MKRISSRRSFISYAKGLPLPRLVLVLGVFSAMVGLAFAQWAPPPEPSIAPIVSAPTEADRDGSKVDDRFEAALRRARATLRRTDAPTDERQNAQAALEEPVALEAIFSAQITAKQLDAFQKAGGEIDHVFTHVSYGWTGRISLGQLEALPAVLGPTLLGIVEKPPLTRHLDQATQCGRVRPAVWSEGYEGLGSGADRITIAILDTGVDGSHTDLSGRQEYWKDWTADNHASAQDLGHHGTHVASIACGSGAAAGVSPTTISYMDLGSMSETAGSFIPGPIYVPASVTSMNWTSTMRWQTGGGVTAQVGHANSDASGGWALLSATTQGSTSPLSETNNSQTNPRPGRTNRYSVYASKVSGSGTPQYAVEHTLSYAGVGDGAAVFRGVAPNSRWAGLKVFRDNGSGNSLDFDEALDDITAKRETHGIKVANMSLGIVGDPGVSTSTRNKVNTAAMNGIVMVLSAGNDGNKSTAGAREIDDPGRAHYAITVSASNDVNQLTDYSSQGFTAPGDGSAGDQDTKPDIIGPGGSVYYSYILAADSNTGDSENNTGANFTDAVANNYRTSMGTSMACPFIAGCAALVIQALQQSGSSWHFTGTTEPLADVLRVKMLLLMTATETNQTRESGSAAPNPTLNRGAKDTAEGYGMVNTDAAVDAAAGTPLLPGTLTDTLGSNPHDKRCLARSLSLSAGVPVNLSLVVPATGDFDLYLYANTPDIYGNPVILTSSVNAGLGVNESISHTPSTTQKAFLVIKRVSGSGVFSLSGYSGIEDWSWMVY
jgi:hypothetical protein